MPRLILGVLFLIAASQLVALADEPTSPPAILVDAAGKEIALEKWSFAYGTRKLESIPGSPDVIEIRELNSTTFKDGILTLVPIQRVQAIEYDDVKKTIQVKVAGVPEPLVGSTRFAGINTIIIEAEAKIGDSGVAAVKYRGGGPKGSFRALRFPKTSDQANKLEGETYTVHIAETKGMERDVIVKDLAPLYLIDGAEKTQPFLMFKKTLKVEFNKLQKLTVVAPPDKVKSAECEVVMKDGQELGLTLLNAIPVDDKKGQPLLGLIGKVPAGYRWFPIHTIDGFEVGEVRSKEKDKDE